MMTESSKCMASVNDCLVDMIQYIDVMIDSAGAYYDGGVLDGIMRRNSSRGYSFAGNNIRNVDNKAINCMKIIIETHRKLKYR